MTTKRKLDIAGLTDTGRSRAHNEDTIGWREVLGLVVLADGMGGHNAGEVASRVAVDTVIDIFEQTDPAQRLDLGDLSVEAVQLANKAIFQRSSDDPDCSGMGTTLVMASFEDGHLTVAHVGDSRLYRFRGGKLELLTTDHSLVQEMVDSGYLTAEEASRSAKKNMITRALGVEADVAVDIQRQESQAGDLFLLCSDGLSDLVPAGEIRDLIDEHHASLQRSCEALVDRANERGGLDNISVIMVRVN